MRIQIHSTQVSIREEGARSKEQGGRGTRTKKKLKGPKLIRKAGKEEWFRGLADEHIMVQTRDGNIKMVEKRKRGGGKDHSEEPRSSWLISSSEGSIDVTPWLKVDSGRDRNEGV